ncbi:hypothetical protein ACWCV9_00835 [Streptomyces sp. NPDC001606]
MRKLTRITGSVGASVALLGGALLATGPAAAAQPLSAAHGPARATTDLSSHACGPNRGLPRRMDPWVAGQIAQFAPAAKRRLAIYDPWVKDQLEQARCGFSAR